MSFHRDFVRGDKTVSVRLERETDDHYRIQVGARTLRVRATALDGGGVRFVVLGPDGVAAPDARAITAASAPGPENSLQVRVDGRTWTLQQPGRRSSTAGAGADGTVRAPMTGTVAKVLCRKGDKVAADQTLVVLTAMKMEHKLTAGIAGVVESVGAAEGATVEQGVTLAVVSPHHSPTAAAPV